jgi:biopolymer transport protein ExbB
LPLRFLLSAASGVQAKIPVQGDVQSVATLATASDGIPPTSLAAASKTPETAENPYRIAALWSTSDTVAKGVLLILAIMSMGSWYILAVKMLEQRKAGTFAREAAEKSWGAGTVAQGAAALNKDSPYHFIAAA